MRGIQLDYTVHHILIITSQRVIRFDYLVNRYYDADHQYTVLFISDLNIFSL